LKSSGQSVALFDFDGTLTHRDTLLPFLRYCLGTVAFGKVLISQAPWLLGFRAGILSNHVVKQRLLIACFKDWRLENLETLGEAYARCTLPQFILPGREAILRWHLSQGHRCYLVSASLGLYLRPWSKSFGFEGVICSEMEVSFEGLITGRLQGRNVFGPEKVVRIKQALRLDTPVVDFAYGDSRGDLEMLSLAKFAWYRGRFRDVEPPGWMA